RVGGRVAGAGGRITPRRLTYPEGRLTGAPHPPAPGRRVKRKRFRRVPFCEGCPRRGSPAGGSSRSSDKCLVRPAGLHHPVNVADAAVSAAGQQQSGGNAPEGEESSAVRGAPVDFRDHIRVRRPSTNLLTSSRTCTR